MASIQKPALVKLAEARAIDAALLLANERYSSAYYLVGYAVEIGLKAVIAGAFRDDTLPDKSFVTGVYTHKLDDLVRLAGLAVALKAKQKASVEFRSNWAIVADWSEQARYEADDPVKARALLTVVCDDRNGVLQWLRAYW